MENYTYMRKTYSDKLFDKNHLLETKANINMQHKLNPI